MADKLIQTFTQIVTCGSTYVFTHSLTAGGVSVAPDEVEINPTGAVWGAATNGMFAGRVVGTTTTLCSVAIDGVTAVGTVVTQVTKRHSIVNVT
jgi:hypothetical protein